LIFIFAFHANFNAQYYYSLSSSPGNPGGLNADGEYPNGSGLPAGWSVILSGSNASPTWSSIQTIPFSFNFNGSAVTSYKVSSSGVLTFDTGAANAPSYNNATIPNASIPDQSVLVWGIQGIGANDNIVTKTFGTSGAQQHWIFFSSYDGGGSWSYWSIVLEEGSDRIYIVDQRHSPNANPQITAGIQIDASTAIMVSGSPNLSNLASTDATDADNYYYEFIQGAPSAVDMAMTSLSIAPTVQAGSTNITGTVTSNSSNNITSIDITWNDGSGANTQTFSVNMNFGDTYDFNHGTTLTTVAGQNYSLDVAVTASGDADPSNDMLSTTISTVSSIVPRIVVGEEKTGEWCGWCPRGAVALANMSVSTPTNFIGIAVHNGDGMTVSSYDGNIGTYISGGYPGGGVDRVNSGNPATFLTMYNSRKNHIAPASVSASGTYDANSINVDITADFVGSLSGDYRLAAVLLEDSVLGAGQANYYSGGNSGQMLMPNVGSMPNYDFAAGPQTVNPYFHDHVAIALGNDQINGSTGSLPGSLNDGDSETYTYTFTRPSNWNVDKIHVVGMLVNGSTGEILNAAKGNIIDVATVHVAKNISKAFNIKVYPNPSNGITNLNVDVKQAGNISISVVNILGKTVYKNKINNTSAGNYVRTIDLSNEASGIYFAKVSVNDQQQVIRINLNK
jgi:hypothetical protein